MRVLPVVFLSSVLLAGCTAVHEGPPVELADVAVPRVVSDAAKAAHKAAEGTVSPPAAPVSPTPAPAMPPPSRGRFSAWIPRRVTPNGDVHAGHGVDVSNKEPQKELTKPPYEIPKAPKQIYRSQSERKGAAGQGAALAPSGAPVLPQSSAYGSVPQMPPLPQEGAYELPRP